MSESRPYVSSDDDRSSGCVQVSLPELLGEFYSDPAATSKLAEFEATERVPFPYDKMLDHHGHMTETVEAYLGQPVDVTVHRCRLSDGHGSHRWYSREITLSGQHSGRVVQYGIVRLDIQALAPEVWRRIESQQIPLGRVLIEHNVLREVQLCGLWKLTVGPKLGELLHVRVGGTIYGRTALIYCDGEPAIELLEVVSP
ncbi:MAG: hypothetical protein AAGA03_06455 [Planctomycetota bacterium]